MNTFYQLIGLSGGQKISLPPSSASNGFQGRAGKVEALPRSGGARYNPRQDPVKGDPLDPYCEWNSKEIKDVLPEAKDALINLYQLDLDDATEEEQHKILVAVHGDLTLMMSRLLIEQDVFKTSSLIKQKVLNAIVNTYRELRSQRELALENPGLEEKPLSPPQEGEKEVAPKKNTEEVSKENNLALIANFVRELEDSRSRVFEECARACRVNVGDFNEKARGIICGRIEEKLQDRAASHVLSENLARSIERIEIVNYLSNGAVGLEEAELEVSDQWPLTRAVVEQRGEAPARSASVSNPPREPRTKAKSSAQVRISETYTRAHADYNAVFKAKMDRQKKERASKASENRPYFDTALVSSIRQTENITGLTPELYKNRSQNPDDFRARFEKVFASSIKRERERMRALMNAADSKDNKLTES